MGDSGAFVFHPPGGVEPVNVRRGGAGGSCCPPDEREEELEAGFCISQGDFFLIFILFFLNRGGKSTHAVQK